MRYALLLVLAASLGACDDDASTAQVSSDELEQRPGLAGQVLVVYAPDRIVASRVRAGEIVSRIELEQGVPVSPPVLTGDRRRIVYAVEPAPGAPWEIVVYDVDHDEKRSLSDIPGANAPTLFLDASERWVVFGRSGAAWSYAHVEALDATLLSTSASEVRPEARFVLVVEGDGSLHLPGNSGWTQVAQGLVTQGLSARPQGVFVHHRAPPAPGADSSTWISREVGGELVTAIELDGVSGLVRWDPDGERLVRTRCSPGAGCNELCEVELRAGATERCVLADGSVDYRFGPTGRYLIGPPSPGAVTVEVFDTQAAPWERFQTNLLSDGFVLLPLAGDRAELFFFEEFEEIFFFDLRSGFPGQMKSTGIVADAVREPDGPLALVNGSSGDAGVSRGRMLSLLDVDAPEAGVTLISDELEQYTSDIQWATDGDWAAFLGSDGAGTVLGIYLVSADGARGPLRLGGETTLTFSGWIFR